MILCTGNAGKVRELKSLMPTGVGLLSLMDVDVPSELPEHGPSLKANALEKARYVHDITGLPCVADDTGLEVDHLGGAPGVYSARYAGDAKDAGENMARLLRELEDTEQRTARFRTVIAFVHAHGKHTFEGVVEGSIAKVPKGDQGFGYDPIFIPQGSERTFAEMDPALKNKISHRAKAMAGFLVFLEDVLAQDQV